MANASTTVQIADALVAELNVKTFSQPFTAVRAYLPEYELKDMATLHVTVVPAEFEGEPNDRSRDREEHKLHVAVQQRFEPIGGIVPLARLDELLKLCEEIRDFLRDRTLASCPEVRRVKTEHKPIYDPKHLKEANQFTGLLAFTYRVVR
jgi:hypothetical protein